MVWIDPAVLTADAWHEAGRLIAALAIALPLLCMLVYAALARALRPTQLIRGGLERIAAGDLTARLPPFDLAELSAVRDVFNQLAENLAAALDQRNELTRKLIAIQDDEHVNFKQAWADPESGMVFCLSEAPNAEAGRKIHERSGHPADNIYQVPSRV